MDFQIAGKLALITGASKGIGFAVAEGLAAEGVNVILSSRDEKSLAKAVQKLRSKGANAHSIVADVSQAESIEALFATCKTKFADPDILLINGGGPPAGKAETLDDAAWARAYDLTLMSAVRLARAAIPGMRAKNWGRIITITSLSIKSPVANLTLSNAFRAAVTGFCKTLSTELAASGITVNSVGPGYTATERLQELFPKPGDDAKLIASIPAKRFGSPEEIASAAVYLASQQAAYMTGQTLIVDGGMVNATY